MYSVVYTFTPRVLGLSVAVPLERGSALLLSEWMVADLFGFNGTTPLALPSG